MPKLIKDTSSFKQIIASPELSVVHFAADWAEQCAQVDTILDALTKQPVYSTAVFATCPAEELSEISLKYKIEAVPTILFFRASKLIDRVDGADAAKIAEKVKKNFGTNEPTEIEVVTPLEQRLKELVNKSKVMLFMKGDRVAPRCGFSKQIVQILNDTGVSYETFDILSDEDVRQGLKTFSNWPTYPQLYVNGELIGGLDIVKEMLASGEFLSALNP